MRIQLDRAWPIVWLAVIALGGCTADEATHPASLKDFPLFTNQDGNSDLSIRVVDARRGVQDYADTDTSADRVRFTLTSASNLSASRTASNSITIGASQQFTTVFTKLRPGTDYVLKADLYKQSDLDLLGGEGAFAQSIVRAEGQNVGYLTLTAGANTLATIKINSVGTINFTASALSNVVSDFVVVQGDTVTVDSGMTTVNNPRVQTIKLEFRSAGGQLLTTTTSANAASSVTYSWVVPTYAFTGASESAVVTLTGLDSLSNAITTKTQTVTVYKGATITPVTLN